ncbi:hypothetical protein [Nocardioides zeicaulis]|uniref:Uncharacterized protein n=1 Tax=Nocardioides zeicaulis TaxID=1776857 RepID=A0ABV6E1I6_9ACTN
MTNEILTALTHTPYVAALASLAAALASLVAAPAAVVHGRAAIIRARGDADAKRTDAEARRLDAETRKASAGVSDAGRTNTQMQSDLILSRLLNSPPDDIEKLKVLAGMYQHASAVAAGTAVPSSTDTTPQGDQSPGLAVVPDLSRMERLLARAASAVG